MNKKIFFLLLGLNILFVFSEKKNIIFLNEKTNVQKISSTSLDSFKIVLFGNELNKGNKLKIEIYLDQSYNNLESKIHYSYIKNEHLKTIFQNEIDYDIIIPSVLEKAEYKNCECNNNKCIAYFNIEINCDTNAIYFKISEINQSQMKIKTYIDKNNNWIIAVGISALILLLFEGIGIYYYEMKNDNKKGVINKSLVPEIDPSLRDSEEAINKDSILPMD